MAWRSCCVLLRLTGEELLRSPGRGSSFQQRSGFRKVSRKPEKKVEEDFSPAPRREAPPPREAPPTPPRAFGRLVRPLLFTVGFTGVSFGGAAIWQYESLKTRVQDILDQLASDWLDGLRTRKRGDVRKEINQLWNSLSEGQRTVSGLILANVVVFSCWRVPALQRLLLRYFTADPASSVRCWPLLLSTFSHASFFHLAANMYVLWSFSSSAVSLLGREQFLAVYLSAGVVSSFASYVSKTATGRFGPSLGASGAIMTILALVCSKLPEAKLAVVFLPMFTFTAANALKAIVAMDTAGLLLGWRLFDHAAHLGGALFGVWYVSFGHELIWKNREPFVKLWHDLRTGGGGGGGRGGGGGGAL